MNGISNKEQGILNDEVRALHNSKFLVPCSIFRSLFKIPYSIFDPFPRFSLPFLQLTLFRLPPRAAGSSLYGKS